MNERTADEPHDGLRTRLFRVGDDVYDRADVAMALQLGGEWAELRREAREGLSCQARLAADECSLDESAVRDLANEFRYARKLLSADETRAWLARRQITPAQWMDFIRRSRLRSEAGDQLGRIVDQYPVAEDALRDLLLADAICSARFEAVGRRLAGRAAVQAGLAQNGRLHDAGATATRSAGVDAAADLGIPAAEALSRMARLRRLEASFARWCDGIATPDAIAAQVRHHQLDWIRVELGIAHFDEASGAEEAMFCTRDDGMTLAEVAASAGTRYERVVVHLDKVDAALRDRLLGAGRGDVLGPLQHEDRFAVIVIDDKVLPNAVDDEIRLRARQSLLATAVERELNERVVWEAEL